MNQTRILAVLMGITLLVAAIGCSFIPLGEVAPTPNIEATVQARLKQERAAQPTTTPVVVIWGTQGTGDGRFKNPRGVAVASDGSVYVADTYNHSVQRFTSEGVFVSNWGTNGTGDGEFKNPYGVAVASDGSVYVADTDNHRIQKFTVGP